MNDLAPHGKVGVFKRALLSWGVSGVRRFPWRETRDPYAVIVAELMLRRTKAAQVLPVYNTFIGAYPTLMDLANAAPSNIRRICQPLGLHWRVENLVELSQEARHNRLRRIPASIEELQQLSGVGPYVAGAVRCLAFGYACPVVDSNVVRVLSRFFGLSIQGEARRSRRMVDLAARCVDRDAPRDYNLALIDFGALVCTPNRRGCAACPLSAGCSWIGTCCQGDICRE